MNSNRAKIILLTVFVLTLGAGVTAGILAARLPHATVAPTAGPVITSESSLAAELDLTPEQSERMQKIWEGVRDLSVESQQKSYAAQSVRDDAVRKLIPADKIDAFNQIERSYSETNATLEGRRKSAFNRAVDETTAILTLAQRKKYKEILEKRLGAEEIAGHDPLGGAAVPPAASQPS